MYTYYTGVKTTLNVDDTSAIQSLYGAPSDPVNNWNFATATNLTPYINPTGGWLRGGHEPRRVGKPSHRPGEGIRHPAARRHSGA